MEYRINRIAHSGTYGDRGIDRTEDVYLQKIGRTVDLEMDFIKPGLPLFVKYIKNTDGSDMIGKALRTSYVVSVCTFENIVRVETRNSIFEFERVRE
ncbi:hypothetical protein [Clostridium sp. AF32-12BH]|uniref:hypothetical protein n=1 Tax=Clostridium sp. AF32-12BH TaxID=2292006 RepID=UPI000E52DCEB|nr:hypothetical protein [Clostridium sp. AF32-12BH]RHP46905.1 hypothetical protein DWZ40_08345 [Clostridium sp. AF32-12BH]